MSKPNPLAVMQPDEQIICEVKRHPIGLVGNYVTAAFALIVMAVLVVLIPHFVTDVSTQIKSLLLLGFGVMMALTLLFLYIATVIYHNNRWIVTSDSITQVTQTGLLRKQVSQLSLANLEDVTSESNGLLPNMFHYGVLKVESAGERAKFTFPYCPMPNKCAREILAAREAFIRNDPAMAKRANDKLDVPPYQTPTSPQVPVSPPSSPMAFSVWATICGCSRLRNWLASK